MRLRLKSVYRSLLLDLACFLLASLHHVRGLHVQLLVLAKLGLVISLARTEKQQGCLHPATLLGCLAHFLFPFLDLLLAGFFLSLRLFLGCYPHALFLAKPAYFLDGG